MFSYIVVAGDDTVERARGLLSSGIARFTEADPTIALSPEIFYRGLDGAVQQVSRAGADGTPEVFADGPFLDALNG